MADIFRKEVEGAQFFRAEDNNETVGFAMSSLTENGRLSLDSIHVIPGQRKKGVGTALLEAVIGWGKEKGTTEMTGDFFPEYRGGRDEKEVRQFYEKRGIVVGEDKKLKGKIK